MMGLLYDVESYTVNYHLKNVFKDGELQKELVLRNFRITAAGGKTMPFGKAKFDIARV